MKKNKILLLIADALEVDSSSISIDTKLGDLEEWDSLGQLEILTMLDEALDGRASNIRELSECFSVKSILNCLVKANLISD